MSRIVTNVQSLVAQRVLGQQNSMLNQSLTRLSTGLRINTGADDPAGLIGSESLRAEKVAIGAAIDNARRADNVLSIAEGALVEVNRLLLELEDLVDRSANEAGLSQAEMDANQDQIDAILGSIDRISNTSEFNGKKLLGGGFDFNTSGAAVGSSIVDASINNAKVPAGSTRQVTVDVVAASEFAYVSGAGTGAAGILTSAITLEVAGNYGSEVLSFHSSTSLASIAAAINTSTELTGVQASVSANNVIFRSVGYGSDAMVSVEVLSGTFTSGSSPDYGVDGTVLINGATANVRGLEASIHSSGVDASFTLDSAFGGTAGGSVNFHITGGGATFSIAPEVSLVGMETLGLQSVSTGSLGNNAIGFLTTLQSGSTNDIGSRNFATAQRVLHAAQEQVSTMRGRIGAFQKNTLQTAVNSLQIALENTSAAESAIRETDFAETTSALTRAQILVNSSTSVLQLANAQPQSVLQLLS